MASHLDEVLVKRRFAKVAGDAPDFSLHDVPEVRGHMHSDFSNESEAGALRDACQGVRTECVQMV